MREIKFRAWNGSKMIDAFDLSCNPKYWWKKCKDYPLMQYTGLKDITGQDIYEGDIITREDRKRGEVVEFNDGAFRISLKGGVFHTLGYVAFCEKPKIIGNIYAGKKNVGLK